MTIRLRRLRAEHAAATAVRDKTKEPIRLLTHVANIGKTVDEQPLWQAGAW